MAASARRDGPRDARSSRDDAGAHPSNCTALWKQDWRQGEQSTGSGSRFAAQARTVGRQIRAQPSPTGPPKNTVTQGPNSARAGGFRKLGRNALPRYAGAVGVSSSTRSAPISEAEPAAGPIAANLSPGATPTPQLMQPGTQSTAIGDNSGRKLPRHVALARHDSEKSGHLAIGRPLARTQRTDTSAAGGRNVHGAVGPLAMDRRVRAPAGPWAEAAEPP